MVIDDVVLPVRGGADPVKMLMFYAPTFWWEPLCKILPEAPDTSGRHQADAGIVAFIHAESVDGADPARVVTRALKNIKWLAGKFGAKAVVLHYFSHLSSDSSPPGAARDMVEAVARRLAGAGFRVDVTPWGWTSRWGMEVAGDSLARVFVDIGPRETSHPEEEA